MDFLRSYLLVDHLQTKKYVGLLKLLHLPNFDDWKWSTDERCIRNEIISYKTRTLGGLLFLFLFFKSSTIELGSV